MAVAGGTVALVAAALSGCMPAHERPQLWSPYGPPGFRQPGAPMPFVPSPAPEPPAQAEGDGAPDPSEYRAALADPDALVQHTFVLTDGSAVTCVLQLAAASDNAVGGDSAAVALAAETLRTTDWETVISAPSALSPLATEQADPAQPDPAQAEAYRRSDEAMRRIVTALFDRVPAVGYSVMGQSSCG